MFATRWKQFRLWRPITADVQKLANLDENMKFKGGPRDKIYRRRARGTSKKSTNTMFSSPKRRTSQNSGLGLRERRFRSKDFAIKEQRASSLSPQVKNNIDLAVKMKRAIAISEISEEEEQSVASKPTSCRGSDNVQLINLGGQNQQRSVDGASTTRRKSVHHG